MLSVYLIHFKNHAEYALCDSSVYLVEAITL